MYTSNEFPLNQILSFWSFLRRVTLWSVYSENEEIQGEEAYDSEEVSIQPDKGLQTPRPAGFILCCFH